MSEVTTAAEALNDLLARLSNRTPPCSGALPTPTTRSRVPAHACPACGGAGFVVPDLPYTDPGFGKVVRCTTCANFLATCRLTPEEQKLTVNDINPRPDDTGGYVVALRFLAKEMLRDPFGFLSIAGVKGAGKSMVSAALVATFARSGREAVYYTATEIAAQLTNFEDGDPAKFSERLKRAPVLAIDEIDKIKWSEWIVRTLGDVLDYRHRNAERMVTILTMNRTPDAWPREEAVYVEHIESRLADGRFNRYWPEAFSSRLPACLESFYDLGPDGQKRHYAPGLFIVSLPDVRPSLRR